eukprot:COSAG01_NODE_7100_length_3353_cov_96.797480_5_plen_105_part_00
MIGYHLRMHTHRLQGLSGRLCVDVSAGEQHLALLTVAQPVPYHAHVQVSACGQPAVAGGVGVLDGAPLLAHTPPVPAHTPYAGARWHDMVAVVHASYRSGCWGR